jgi:hypothetical protein
LVVKLRAYRLSNGYKEQGDLAMLSGLEKVQNVNAIVYTGAYTDTHIVYVEQTFGIIGRLFIGDKSGGGTTEATALSITFEDHTIWTTPWSNGNPIGGTVKMRVYGVTTPLTSGSTDELIDITDATIDDTLEIIRQIESLDKFDLRVSRCSFSVNETTELATFLNKYWNPDGYGGREYIIVAEVEGKFWGISDFDNINYDGIEKTYHFDAYDPIKWLQKNIWGLRLPSLGSNYRNLYSFFYVTCNLFFEEGKIINIDVNGNQNWSNDYVFVYDSASDGYLHLDHHLTIADMMVEIMKHYGATIYFGTNGNLNFTTRNKKNEASYDESVMLEDLNKSYELHEYAGLLINVSGEWQLINGTWSQWEGWVLVWEAYNELQTTVITANLNNIPKNFSYLDLRQELPDKVFDYRMFAQRTRDEIYADYKELFRSSVLYETTLNGTDYEIYDTLVYNGEEYTMNYLQIDMTSQNTKIRAYKSL